jgi:hypothetical protein
MSDDVMVFELWDDNHPNGVVSSMSRKKTELKDHLKCLGVGDFYDLGNGKAWQRVK